MTIAIFLTSLIAAMMIYTAPAMAQERSPLRYFVWGATQEDIRKFETGKFYKSEERI